VLGCHYNGYTHGATEAAKLPAAAKHPILQGIEGPYRLQETLYRSSPLGHSCETLMRVAAYLRASPDLRTSTNVESATTWAFVMMQRRPPCSMANPEPVDSS